MKSNLKFLYKYLSDKKIDLDKDEFDFQFKSHPDYPSLLALSDTLTFFNITNSAIKIDSSKLELLPKSFIAILKDDGIFFSYVNNNKKNIYTYTNKNGKNISRVSIKDLKKKWGNIILLIENENINLRNKKFPFLILIPFLLLTASLLINFSNLWIVLFYIFPVIGFILSLFSLKDIFNFQSDLFSKLCNAAFSFSCDEVVNSSKWKVFEKVSFNDLSLIFFSTQFFSYFFFIIIDKYYEYLIILKILLLLSIPIVISSIVYQKFVVKKWCPICLLIIAVLVAELFSIFIQRIKVYNLGRLEFFLFFFIFISTLISWYSLKQLLIKVRDLKEANIKNNRLKRNYFIFKNTLLATKKHKLPKTQLVFGNIKAKLNVDIITSPYCRHCIEPHKMLNEMLHRYGDKIAVKIIYFVDIKNSNDENQKSLFRNLINIKLTHDDESFNMALDEWLKEKNYKKWFAKYDTNYQKEEIDIILNNQYQWCLDNNFNFTPCLFINGYKYPIGFEIADFPYYINELIDDILFDQSNVNN